eukprot:9191805-Ditylum_brightwellii.AAC.1
MDLESKYSDDARSTRYSRIVDKSLQTSNSLRMPAQPYHLVPLAHSRQKGWQLVSAPLLANGDGHYKAEKGAEKGQGLQGMEEIIE